MAQLKTTGDVKIGSKSYTDSNLTPTEIATLAFAYTTAPTGKVISKNLDKNINVANDLAKLTGGKQLQPGMQTGNKALLVFILKNKLVSTDEYKDLYRKLVDLHKKVVSAINKTNPKGSAKAGRAASKDMKGEFDESINEAKDEPEVISQLRNVVKRKQQQSIKDPLTNKTVKVDVFSAQAILAVYDKLSPKNQKQYVTTTIPRMAEVAFKLIK